MKTVKSIGHFLRFALCAGVSLSTLSLSAESWQVTLKSDGTGGSIKRGNWTLPFTILEGGSGKDISISKWSEFRASEDVPYPVELDFTGEIEGGYSIVKLEDSAFDRISAYDRDGKGLSQTWHKSYLKKVKLPNTLQEMGGSVFLNVTSLETVEPFFPHSMRKLGNNVFKGCPNLTGKVKLNLASDSGGNLAFDGASITDIEYEDSIPDGINRGLPKLTNIVIRSEATYGGYAFNYCKTNMHVWCYTWTDFSAAQVFAGFSYNLLIHVPERNEKWKDWLSSKLRTCNSAATSTFVTAFPDFPVEKLAGQIDTRGFIAYWKPPKKGGYCIIVR